MKPTVFDELPAHVLLVHLVVVLVPLTALTLVGSLSSRRVRRRLGGVTPVLASATLLCVPLTTNAGQWLLRRTRSTALVRHHVQLGEQLVYWSAAVCAVAVLWWACHDSWLLARLAPLGESVTAAATGRPVRMTLVVAGVIAAVGSTVLTYRTALIGLHTVWSRVMSYRTGT